MDALVAVKPLNHKRFGVPVEANASRAQPRDLILRYQPVPGHFQARDPAQCERRQYVEAVVE